ncbi:hypothetical protein PSHT_03454 [Puccinia striiformis]|uniref:Uncharacterized protein n=1 Tax=Puccinia striiformis TaxID=27350 RepID=A0A2S4WFL9_9BASI|nr:hypothetical protein H4Q26_007402 [Puccinia striiformis f. sp. tritici PST-130]POW20508.1 hypothetical protein PSHT_03454 [Puccinia striiformis]
MILETDEDEHATFLGDLQPPSLPPTLTTVLLKFDKITVLLPVTKKSTIADLKKGFLEAMSGTTTSGPKDSRLEDASSFQIYRSSTRKAQLNDTGSGVVWRAHSDDHATLSDLFIDEAETLGIGFKNSKGSYDTPVIEIWKELETEG